VLTELAKNTKVAFDANKTITQPSALFASGAVNGAIVLNMDKNKKPHKFFVMNDVMNTNHMFYSDNFCTFGSACHVYKTSIPLASSFITVFVDRAKGSSEYAGRYYTLQEGVLYVWNGKGFDSKGSITGWKAGLANKRRLVQTIRRLQAPTDKPSAVTELAKNTNISFDANKAIYQLAGLLGSTALEGGIVINASTDKKSHKLFAMNDVMNMGHHLYNEIYCALNTACHVYKTKLPLSSPQIKVCVDGPNGAGAYAGNTMIVSEGLLYVLDGAGISLKGSVASWKAALHVRSRLFRNKNLESSEADPTGGMSYNHYQFYFLYRFEGFDCKISIIKIQNY
jgi:hypothetical protein